MAAGTKATSRLAAAEGNAAVVIGAGAIATAIARSLGRCDVEVFIWGSSFGPAKNCRYLAGFTDIYRDGEDVSVGLWRAALNGPRRGLLLPSNDDGVEFIARRGSELLELGYELPEMDPELALRLIDKRATYSLARGVGLEVPRTAPTGNGGAPDAALAGLAFPCGLKPVHSHRFARYFDGRDPRSPTLEKLFVVNEPGELETALRRSSELGLEMLLTELVPGMDSELFSYVAYVDARGRILTGFTFRKLRQYPPQYGVASFTIEADFPDVAEAGRRFLGGIGYRGPAQVEFKRAPDGVLKLIECNPRLTIELRHSKADLAHLVYEQSTGRRLRSDRGRRPVRRLWDPLPDVRGLRTQRRHGGTTIRRWVGGLLRGTGLHVFDPTDPGPTIGYHRRIALRRARMLRGAITAWSPPARAGATRPERVTR